MNIQELRVYSHVLVDGNEETIVGIDAVKNEVLLDGWVFSVPLDRLRGIPLTETWLARLHYYDGKNIVFARIKKVENTLQVLTSRHVINYVHELENIMAAEYIFN